MSGLAEPMDALRIALGEVDVLALLTAGTFDAEDWVDPDLELQRKHRFRATDCGSDPGYPGNRQTADLHFRKLTCKALPSTAWDVDRAAMLLAAATAICAARCARGSRPFSKTLRASSRRRPPTTR